MSADQLSLYLDLEEGEQADLEATSRASIALVQTVRQVAVFIDPFSEVKLDLVDTAEGSLWLNTKIKLLASGAPVRPTLYAIMLVTSTWIGTHALDFVAEKVGDHVWEQVFGKEASNLSDQDKKEIVEIAMKAIEARAGEKESQKVFAEIERDPAVKGVGITADPSKRPRSVVPRSEFYTRSGPRGVEEPITRRRTTIEPKKVVLVSPVLEMGTRRWKFRAGKTEFGAPVKDKLFLAEVLSGKMPIIMKSNVQMTVELETVEEFKDGGWIAVDYTVHRVLGAPTQFMGRQTSFSTDEN